tara:strand:+ start:321 stop:575 length:255 start_codon:yes stop_codon:yes gene_type:complete
MHDISSNEFREVLKARLSHQATKAKQIDNLIQCIEYTCEHDKDAYKVVGFETARKLTEYKQMLEADADATQEQINALQAVNNQA